MKRDRDPEENRKDVEIVGGIVASEDERTIYEMPMKGKVYTRENWPYDRHPLPTAYATQTDEAMVKEAFYEIGVSVRYFKKLSGRHYRWSFVHPDGREYGGAFIDRNNRGDAFSFDVLKEESEKVLSHLRLI